MNFLSKLNIHKYTSYDASEINFDKNINVVIGKNGAGKTHFLNKVLFPFLENKFEYFDFNGPIDLEYEVTYSGLPDTKVTYHLKSAEVLQINDEASVVPFSYLITCMNKNETLFTFFRSNNVEKLELYKHKDFISSNVDYSRKLNINNLSSVNKQSFDPSNRSCIVQVLNDKNRPNFLDHSILMLLQDVIHFQLLTDYSNYRFSLQDIPATFPSNFNYTQQSIQDFVNIKIRLEINGSGHSVEYGSNPSAIFNNLFINIIIDYLSKNLKKDPLFKVNPDDIGGHLKDELLKLPSMSYFFKNSRFSELLFTFFNFNINLEEGKKYNLSASIHILLKNKNLEILPLTQSLTDGEKRFFVFCVSQILTSKTFYLIDEVENGLHPEWISYIMKSKKQLFITSHNPFVIDNSIYIKSSEELDSHDSLILCKTKSSENDSFQVRNLNEVELSRVSKGLKINKNLSSLLSKYHAW
ncbi:hypothetical protein DAY19_02050 [Halobacteriovorax vibrionivorans]|uniref:ATPase AAA-type core domain-containing protein n=1 Tax=Halobacteriovorax vibrionivorans TaxID=2152716 RepID=A0ABY0IHZ7_9BACT|nr:MULTISPECIES: AAA family ATPase [Halobacteriovorax]RZF22577.1 hypothetical protein DAY19_02050 [Halobacteriovorax vibrionivorans]TGD47770.1 hypothetical protein EP118_07415 [Halobacteriovorax sp. Y22]